MRAWDRMGTLSISFFDLRHWIPTTLRVTQKGSLHDPFRLKRRLSSCLSSCKHGGVLALILVCLLSPHSQMAQYHQGSPVHTFLSGTHRWYLSQRSGSQDSGTVS